MGLGGAWVWDGGSGAGRRFGIVEEGVFREFVFGAQPGDGGFCREFFCGVFAFVGACVGAEGGGRAAGEGEGAVPGAAGGVGGGGVGAGCGEGWGAEFVGLEIVWLEGGG